MMNSWWSELSLKSKLQIPIQLLLVVVMILMQHTALNKLLNKSTNQSLLAELQCVLDRQPIARRKAEQRNSKVYVYKDGKLVRIEHSNGKVMKYL